MFGRRIRGVVGQGSKIAKKSMRPGNGNAYAGAAATTRKNAGVKRTTSISPRQRAALAGDNRVTRSQRAAAELKRGKPARRTRRELYQSAF